MIACRRGKPLSDCDYRAFSFGCAKAFANHRTGAISSVMKSESDFATSMSSPIRNGRNSSSITPVAKLDKVPCSARPIGSEVAPDRHQTGGLDSEQLQHGDATTVSTAYRARLAKNL